VNRKEEDEKGKGWVARVRGKEEETMMEEGRGRSCLQGRGSSRASLEKRKKREGEMEWVGWSSGAERENEKKRKKEKIEEGKRDWAWKKKRNREGVRA
jgi:hypothetical protein